MTNSIFVNKKVWIIGLVAIAVVLIGFGISSARAAVMEQREMAMTAGGNYAQIPQINGSINVGQAVKNAIHDNLKVSFLQASEIAGKQVVNDTLVGGHMGVVQGYLVYPFYAVNAGNQTGHLVVIDAGNGKVLYISASQSMFGQFCPWERYGTGAPWHGPTGSWNASTYGGNMWQHTSWWSHQW